MAPRRNAFFLGRLLGVFCIPLLTSACDLAKGLTDLGDSLRPDAALLDSPSRKLAEGKYSRLLLDGSLENGGFVLAFRNDTKEQRLAIVPFLNGEGCEIKNAFAFERLSSRVDVALSGLVAVQTSEGQDGRGTIRFVGFDCEDRMAPLDDASIPRIEFPTSIPRGLLTLTRDRELFLADADEAKLVPAAKGVTSATVIDDTLWVYREGTLTALDQSLSEIETLGEGVTEFVPFQGEGPQVVYVDETGVHLWARGEESVQLAKEGCAVTPLDATTIAYFSPCESRSVRIDVLGSKIGSSAKRVRLIGPDHGVALSAIQTSFGLNEDVSRFLVQSSADLDALQRTLVALEVDPAELDDEAEIVPKVTALSSEATLVQGQIYEDWDGTRGTLLEVEKDKTGRVIGLLKVAEGVASLPGGSPYSGRGALVRFNGSTGDLVLLKKNSKEILETMLSTKVPIQNQTIEADTGQIGFVAKLDGEVGDAFLMDGSDVQSVGERALPGTLRFLDQPRALSYLSTQKNGRVDLIAYLIESGLSQTVHEGVAEYRIVPWPSPGILYSIHSGKDQGLWFSKAR